VSHTLEYARYELRRTFRNRRLYILSFAFPLALYYAMLLRTAVSTASAGRESRPRSTSWSA
jgi:hypothetical protein